MGLRDEIDLFIETEQERMNIQYSAEEVLISAMGTAYGFPYKLTSATLNIHKDALAHKYGFLRHNARGLLDALLAGEKPIDDLNEMNGARYASKKVLLMCATDKEYLLRLKELYIVQAQPLLKQHENHINPKDPCESSREPVSDT